MNGSPDGLPGLASCCNRLAHAALPSDYALLSRADLASGHPWAFLADIALTDPGSVAYYRYLFGLARLLNPVNILEVGTAFGLGSAAFVQGAPGLGKLISLDLGIFTRQYEIVEQSDGQGWPVMERYREERIVSDGQNVDFARRILGDLAARLRPGAQISLYRVNTQPGGSDNFDVLVDVPRWFEVPELVEELERTPIDLLFIDGKHTDDGLYQDFKSFFRFVRPGGVVLCDDLHDSTYPYAWAGQTLASFERAMAEFADDIEESTIWPFPQLPDWYGQEPVVRPFGLVRKRGDGAGAALPRGDTALVLSELEGLPSADPLVRNLRLFHRHHDFLCEVSTLSLADQDAARLLRQLKEQPALLELLATTDVPVEQLRLLKDHPAAISLLVQREPLAEDLEVFQQGPAPASRGSFALLLFLLRRAVARRLRALT